MVPRPSNHLLHARELCALCENGTTQEVVVHLKFTKPGQLRLCESCFERLIDDKSPQRCGMCSRGAEYGTWDVEDFRTFNRADPQTMRYIPSYRLFCEDHFRELIDIVESRPRQARLAEFIG